MNLSDLSKKVLPHMLRNMLGVHGIKAVSRNALTMTLFSLVFDFRMPGVRMLPDGLCYRAIGNRNIICHRDGFRIFHEIFDSRPYERFWRPERGDVVLDLGAYVGMFIYRASLLVGETGKVIAVEPDDRNFELLERNIASLPNATILLAALGERNGITELNISPKSTCHSTIIKSGMSRKVPVYRVDTIVEMLNLAKVDFVKIDVEEAELSVLEGATDTLAMNGSRKVVVECYHNNNQSTWKEVARKLVSLGYKVDGGTEYVYGRKLC